MKNSKLLFCTFLLLLPMLLFPQKIKEVVIEGDAPAFAIGKTARLVVFEDLLNYTPSTVATAVIDKKGHFTLKYKTHTTRLTQLVIQMAKAEFFIEPEKRYEISVDIDEELFKLPFPEEYGGFLQITNLQPDTNELNYRLALFSNLFNKITDEYLPYFTYYKDKAQYDTMTDILHQYFDFAYAPQDFYQSYLYYTYASLENIMYEKYPDTLYRRYLDNEYFLYDQPAFMDFFNLFYEQYLLNSPKIPKELLLQHINIQPDYLELFNLAGRDPRLQNERIRELVIIKNLGEFYGQKQFSKSNVLSLLDYIETHTHFPEHPLYIQNLKRRLATFAKGGQLPATVFKEVNGADFKIEKMKGKWTYIQFFASSCEDCLREMMILKEIEQKYKDSLNILSISLDYDFNDFSNFRQSYGKLFPWQFVHFNQHCEWLEQVHLFGLPDYLLLAPDGSIANRYPATPDKGLSRFLLQKFSKEEETGDPLSPHFKGE